MVDIDVFQTVTSVSFQVEPNTNVININKVTSEGGGGNQDLQSVTDIGSTTTNPITANSFVKSGGTGTNVLLDNGNTVALSSIGGGANLSPTQTATNFTINSDTGTDATIPLGNGTLAGATSNDFTSAEKNKLSGIATGAEVNVNADWNAVSGDAQILNKPTLTNFVPYTGATGNVDLGLNDITATTLIKQGGTSSQILAADGSVITAGTNITITGGQISSIGGAGGGGSSVNYYLNGGTSQGDFGGTTYYEFSKTPVIGTGADFNRNTNGYIASFITDVADPSLLLIPAGNWNLEFFFSSSSAGGSPSFYVELYKYDGTTFTLIASGSAVPEGITNGTAIDAYFTALAVPETVLTVNDRLAIRVYVNASSKTITLHTQNGYLCEVITTFSAGLTALNGLQAQVQNFATGTTGTDFAINSSGSTHTFNLPDASSTARGIVTTGVQTIAGAKTFTGAISASNLSGTNTGDNATNTQYSGLAASKQNTLQNTVNIKSINGNSLLGSGDLTVTGSTPSQSAYTILANNTAASAVPTEQVFKEVAEQVYTPIPVWTATTAPTGTTNHTYQWSQIGKTVNVRLNLSYTSGGAGATIVICPFPTDLPIPISPSGLTTASANLYYGIGLMTNLSNSQPTTLPTFTSIRRNATNTGYDLIMSRASNSPSFVYISIQYFTT